MAIPKIIHQVWEGRTEPSMPARLQILARTWQEQNPDWEYHLWNGEEMDNLVETHFPEYLSIYKSFPYSVQRWDTIRYMILYLYGGVYADLDSECFRPIDELLEGKNMCFGEEPPSNNIYPEIDLLTGNAFMASEPKHEGWLKVLEEIQEAMKQEYPQDGRAIIYTTGPLMLSKLFPKLQKLGNVQYISYMDVTPVAIRDMCQYIHFGERNVFNEKIKNAYCAHYYFGYWLSQCSK